MIKGRAANTWLALTDCTMSANVNMDLQRQAKLHISTLVDLFYDALDAEKTGKAVSTLSLKCCFVFELYLNFSSILVWLAATKRLSS